MFIFDKELNDKLYPWMLRQWHVFGFVPLAQSGWPENVIKKIIGFFSKYADEDIAQVKLVEPTARAFSGSDGTNWEKLKDYFEWEAAQIFDEKQAVKLQTAAKKKYNGEWSSKSVYDLGGR